jgi:hypothetical protein
MPLSIEIETIRDPPWAKEMCPGHFFMWLIPRQGLTFYSIVLETDASLVKGGYRLTRTYGPPYPSGCEMYVRQNLAVFLLSREQMDAARRLGWPQEPAQIHEVVQTPPS